MSTHQRHVADAARARRLGERSAAHREDPELPEVTGAQACAACGCRVPSPDLLFTGSGVMCLTCHGEQEVAATSISAWRELVPTLAAVGALVPLAWLLTFMASRIDFGPVGGIGWVVMNLIPACAGAALVVVALRHVRDAWVNPLDEDLDGWAQLGRGSAGAVALLGSLGATLSLLVGAMLPFL